VGARARVKGGNIFLVGKMLTLFSCSVHQKDVAGTSDP